MSATVEAGGYTATSTRLSEMWPAARDHLKKNLPQVAIFAVIGALGSYLINVYWIAKRYEGTNVPSGAPVTTQDAFRTGMLFWIFASSVVFGLIGHRRAVGATQFWEDVRCFPGSVKQIFANDASGFVHLFWGFAVSSVLTGVLAPSLRGVLAIGVALTIPSVLGRVVMSYASRLWAGVLRKLNPEKDRPPVPIVAPAVAGFGAAVAMGVGFLVDDTTVQLVLAGVAAALAIFISQQSSGASGDSGGMGDGGGSGGSPVSAVLLVAFGGLVVLAVAVGSSRSASADDGGYAECGSSWSEWWSCDGARRVRDDSRWGGFAAGLGAALGGGMLPGFFGGGQSTGRGGGGGGTRVGDPATPDGDPGGAWDPPASDIRADDDGGLFEPMDPPRADDDDDGGLFEPMDPRADDDGLFEPVDEPTGGETRRVWDPYRETFRDVSPAEAERLQEAERNRRRVRQGERDAELLGDIRADRARVDELTERLRRRDELEERLRGAEIDSELWNDPEYWDEQVRDDAFDGMLRDVDGLPDEFRDLGRAINEELNDPENWRVLEETLAETAWDAAGGLSPIPFGDGRENITESGEQLGRLGQAMGEAFAQDPVGFVYGLTPLQDFEDAVDPDKTLGERLGHLGAGLLDVFGGGGAASTAAETMVDAHRATNAADAARDAARAADAGEGVRDVGRAADAGEGVRDVVRAGDVGDDLRDAERAVGGADGDGLLDEAADGGRRTDGAAAEAADTADDVVDDLADEVRGGRTRDRVEEQIAANRGQLDDADLMPDELARREAWEQNRRDGADRVDEFASLGEDAPDLSPEELAQRRRDAALDVQGNKQALQDMKSQPPEVQQAFNDEMRGIYDRTDGDMRDWARDHVNAADSGPLRDVEIRGELDLVKADPKEPPVGFIIYRDQAVPPNEIHLFEPTNPKPGISVGADRDFAVYVRKGDSSGADNPLISIDSRASGRAYHDSFFEHAGGERTMERLGMDPVRADQIPGDEIPSGLSAEQMARQRNADALAARLDQMVTDDLHPEAYTNVDRILHRPFGPLDDAQQVGMTSTYKGDHWAERAADSLGGQAESELAEGFRQTTKQHGNQVTSRMEQLQRQAEYLHERGELAGDIPTIRQHPALERGIEIMNKVGDEGLSPVDAQRMLRNELGLTSNDVNRMIGEQLEAMNDMVPSEVTNLQHRMNGIADDLYAGSGRQPSVDEVWDELRRRDGA